MKAWCRDRLVKPLWNDFPWTAGVWVWFPITTSGHVCLSGCVRMFFKHSWLRHLCLKIIPTRPLRHVWPEVVMENHTLTPVVHGKSHTYFDFTPLWAKLRIGTGSCSRSDYEMGAYSCIPGMRWWEGNPELPLCFTAALLGVWGEQREHSKKSNWHHVF